MVNHKKMVLFFKNLYEQKYGLKAPKITTVEDGIYIYSQSGFDGPKAKIFVSKDDFLESPEFYKTYLEDVDDRVIRKVEGQK